MIIKLAPLKRHDDWHCFFSVLDDTIRPSFWCNPTVGILVSIRGWDSGKSITNQVLNLLVVNYTIRDWKNLTTTSVYKEMTYQEIEEYGLPKPWQNLEVNDAVAKILKPEDILF